MRKFVIQTAEDTFQIRICTDESGTVLASEFFASTHSSSEACKSLQERFHGEPVGKVEMDRMCDHTNEDCYPDLLFDARIRSRRHPKWTTRIYPDQEKSGKIYSAHQEWLCGGDTGLRHTCHALSHSLLSEPNARCTLANDLSYKNSLGTQYCCRMTVMVSCTLAWRASRRWVSRAISWASLDSLGIIMGCLTDASNAEFWSRFPTLIIWSDPKKRTKWHKWLRLQCEPVCFYLNQNNAY